jgi:hypothetical protein
MEKPTYEKAITALTGAKLVRLTGHCIGAICFLMSIACALTGNWIGFIVFAAITVYVSYRVTGTQMFIRDLTDFIDKNY